MAEFIGEIIIEILFQWIGGTIRWALFRGLLQRKHRSYTDYLGDEITNGWVLILIIMLFIIALNLPVSAAS